jgi:hypothetical protein
MKNISLARIGMVMCVASGLLWVVGQSANSPAASTADMPKPAPTAETSLEVAAPEGQIERLKAWSPSRRTP